MRTIEHHIRGCHPSIRRVFVEADPRQPNVGGLEVIEPEGLTP